MIIIHKMFSQIELEKYIQDLELDGISPLYGTAENDLMVFAWEDDMCPVETFRSHGYYDKMKELIRKTDISGILYRGVDTKERFFNGNFIDYTNKITSWTTDESIAWDFTNSDDPIILKCSFDNIKGMVLVQQTEKERILDEMKLEIVSYDKHIINVKVV